MIDKHHRLRRARIDAGFESATAAAEKFGWKPPTYSGHENGSRGFKLDDAAKYGAAFGVTPQWLLFGEERAPALARQHVQAASLPDTAAGFADTDLAPYHPPTDRARIALAQITAALAQGARHPVSYQLTRAVPGLALLSGDILICDLHATPRNGQAVVTQIADPDTGEGQTRIWVFHDGRATPPFGEPQPAKGAQFAVVGVALAAFRSLP